MFRRAPTNAFAACKDQQSSALKSHLKTPSSTTPQTLLPSRSSTAPTPQPQRVRFLGGGPVGRAPLKSDPLPSTDPNYIDEFVDRPAIIAPKAYIVFVDGSGPPLSSSEFKVKPHYLCFVDAATACPECCELADLAGIDLTNPIYRTPAPQSGVFEIDTEEKIARFATTTDTLLVCGTHRRKVENFMEFKTEGSYLKEHGPVTIKNDTDDISRKIVSSVLEPQRKFAMDYIIIESELPYEITPLLKTNLETLNLSVSHVSPALISPPPNPWIETDDDEEPVDEEAQLAQLEAHKQMMELKFLPKDGDILNETGFIVHCIGRDLQATKGLTTRIMTTFGKPSLNKQKVGGCAIHKVSNERTILYPLTRLQAGLEPLDADISAAFRSVKEILTGAHAKMFSIAKDPSSKIWTQTESILSTTFAESGILIQVFEADSSASPPMTQPTTKEVISSQINPSVTSSPDRVITAVVQKPPSRVGILDGVCVRDSLDQPLWNTPKEVTDFVYVGLPLNESVLRQTNALRFICGPLHPAERCLLGNVRALLRYVEKNFVAKVQSKETFEGWVIGANPLEGCGYTINDTMIESMLGQTYECAMEQICLYADLLTRVVVLECKEVCPNFAAYVSTNQKAFSFSFSLGILYLTSK